MGIHRDAQSQATESLNDWQDAQSNRDQDEDEQEQIENQDEEMNDDDDDDEEEEGLEESHSQSNQQIEVEDQEDRQRESESQAETETDQHLLDSESTSINPVSDRQVANLDLSLIPHPKGRIPDQSIRAGWTLPSDQQATIWHLTSLSINSKNRIPSNLQQSRYDFMSRPFLPPGERRDLEPIVKEKLVKEGKSFSSDSRHKRQTEIGKQYDLLDHVVGSNRRNSKRSLLKSLVKIGNGSREGTTTTSLSLPSTTQDLGHFPSSFDGTLAIPSGHRSRFPAMLDENDLFRRKFNGKQGDGLLYEIGELRDFFSINNRSQERGDPENVFGWGWMRSEQGE